MNPELMFHTEDEVMFYDTDCGGVVHNLAYLRMIEACRTKLGAKLGMDYKTMSDLQQFAVVVRHEIDYVRPAVLGGHHSDDGMAAIRGTGPVLVRF